MSPRKGFTLIELLVVISIIALLISILLPALRKARQAGTNVQCMSNVRQVAMAMLAYEVDEDRLPIHVSEYPGVPKGHPHLLSRNGGPPYADVRIAYKPYLANANFFTCPFVEKLDRSLEAYPSGFGRIYGDYVLTPGYYEDHVTGAAWSFTDPGIFWIRSQDQWLFDHYQVRALVGDFSFQNGVIYNVKHAGEIKGWGLNYHPATSAGAYADVYYQASFSQDVRLQIDTNFAMKDGSAATFRGDDKLHRIEAIGNPTQSFLMPVLK
ncbi:MAG: prepilin-type N-terminal cleavage/methylation domain-containing protein [Phycisphaeraceae bacterium]|nr:prepilin-type N-terminal cleavage/methylation domain-containing protein [Phycisphaeraceae bacterium]